ncbi:MULTISPECIES: BT_3928 family protein [Sphingobacterium]|uniref:BT_3928 family protein n=1 Tax=Sphingobacterium populi TaxID=1812824 RepID=A0ABW5UAP8_9SPHI|nr:BT_3928 family protein [Sphingobacterium sp. CFCC 11742]
MMNSTTMYTSSASHQKRPNWALTISRFLVGCLFIFSGLIKANDPKGFGYKLEEYFKVFNLSMLDEYSTWIAIVICAFEIILGALLLLGLARNKVSWGLLLLTIFFTFLTFYSAFFEVVSSCGCFGDAIPLTPWQSFLKDLVLLGLILIIVRFRHQIKPLIKSRFSNNLLTILIIIVSFGAGIYTMNFLPIIDFLPYREGNNLPQQMEIPEDAEPDVYEHIYTLKNKSTGESKTVSDEVYMNEKIWEDENWEIIGDPKSTLIKKGFEPAIADLIISDAEGNDVTQEILTNPYFNFVVVSTDVTKLSSVDLLALDRINTTIREVSEDYPIRAVLLTASSSQNVNFINDQLNLVLESFNADLVPLKSMVRSNPGVMLMQNGTVIKKWSKHTFPSKEHLESQFLNKQFTPTAN